MSKQKTPTNIKVQKGYLASSEDVKPVHFFTLTYEDNFHESEDIFVWNKKDQIWRNYSTSDYHVSTLKGNAFEFHNIKKGGWLKYYKEQIEDYKKRIKKLEKE